MPFQSEKQRRYLHANHPEIAKRWERDYANGGILDINESEEIIDDGGNEIELTDYNAAFDDPNDFSTGVKSLFRAKEGGNVRLGPHTATDLLAKKNPDGTRSKYQPPGHRDASSPSSSSNTGSGRDYGMSPGEAQARGIGAQHHGSTTSSQVTQQTEREGGQTAGHVPDIGAVQPQAIQYDYDLDEEKYDTQLQKIQDKWSGNYQGSLKKQQAVLDYGRDQWEKVRDSTNNELKKKVGKKFVEYALTSGVTLGLSDVIGVMVQGFKQNKAKNEFIDIINESIEKYRDLGIPEHSPHTDTLIQKLQQEILDLTQTRDRDDDEKDGDKGPIYDPLTGAVDEEFAQGEYMQGVIDPRDWMAEIRARQAIYQGLKSGWENQQLNSGGLANLFRVKNKY